MSAGKLFDRQPQALPRDAALERQRKEAIVAAHDHMRGHLRPGLKAARLAKHDLALGALQRLPRSGDLRRHVVQEVRLQIKLLGVPAAPAGLREATEQCVLWARCKL